MELTQDQLLYRVQFRFILDNTKSSVASKLFYVYVKKWSALMKYVLSNRTFEMYEDLSLLRKVISKDIKVVDVIEKYNNHLSEKGSNLLIEAQPLFNLAPVDLKAFILSVMGLKSYHVNPSLLN